MVRLCGAALGLFAFAIAILQGLLVHNPPETTVVRALKAMVVFCAVGLAAGWVARRVLDEHTLRRHGEMLGQTRAGDEAGRAEGSSAADANAPT